MKDELQLKLVEILTAMQSAVKSGANFAMEQLPDIALQYIVYGRTLYSIIIIVAIALMVAAWKCGNLIPTTGSDDARFGLAVITILLIFASTVMFATHIKQFTLAWMAPKVFLLKEVSSIIK